MKRCKRTLALLLCAVLCFTALPISAFAAEDWPDVDDSIYDFFTTGSPGSAEGSDVYKRQMDSTDLLV